jgi:hypothetical protein
MSTTDDGPPVGTSLASSHRTNRRAGMAALVPIVAFDIAGPILVQSLARSHGASLTVALALSGVPPAAWILVDMLWRRRVDAVGMFVLSSIVLATLIGLATGSGRLYLLDGAILTGVFGVVCLASLAAPRPLMFHFALTSQGGVESQRGKEFADRWRYASFRRAFVVITVVWGLGFVLQAAVNVAIGKAFVINKILPYLFLAILGAWTLVYVVRAKRRSGSVG